MAFTERILGPKVSREEKQQHHARYAIPKWLFTLAATALAVSVLFPYWELRLKAPQFPEGLQVQAFVNRLVGDVEEVEGLNHYVGMPSFSDGAVLERTVSVAGIIVLAGLLLASLYIHSRWVIAFVFPAVLFPLFFLADLQYWLWTYGHSLDPRAPLSGAVGEFTPPVLGPGEIAQFDTLAWPGVGLILAFVAMLLTITGLLFHRRAYRPLMEDRKRLAEAGAPAPEPVSCAGNPNADHGAANYSLAGGFGEGPAAELGAEATNQ